MDSMDNVRERFEALEKQTEDVKYQPQAHKRPARWWRGIACGLLLVSLVSLPLPSGIAQDEPSTAAEATDATSYAFATIDVPEAKRTASLGINDRREIVGWFVDTAEKVHGYFYSRGHFTTIDPPDSTLTQAEGINNRRQIVGFYDDADGKTHGFVLEKGQFTTIDVPGSTTTEALGINNRGQIVGNYRGADGKIHGFVLAHGRFTTIDVPDAIFTTANGINDNGQIIGRYQDVSTNAHAFVLAHGRFTTIDPPDYVGFSDAHGINARGEIVIEQLTSTGLRNYLFDGMNFTPILPVRGSFSPLAVGINNRSQIVGLYTSCVAPGEHGFLAIPLHEELHEAKKED